LFKPASLGYFGKADQAEKYKVKLGSFYKGEYKMWLSTVLKQDLLNIRMRTSANPQLR
jgi:hypothetical protein